MNTFLIESFIKGAEKNGIRNLWALLPRTHQWVKTNKVHQLRKLNNYYAYGFDELGHRIALCRDGKVRQFLVGEKQ